MRGADLLLMARRRAGLSQAQLADRIARPRSNVARWESGRVQPSYETLAAVIVACGLDPVVSLFALDTSNDAEVRDLLALEPADRLARQVDVARAMTRVADFAPLTVIGALEAEAFDWMLLGRLAANLRGSPVVPTEREVVVYPGPQAHDAASLEEAMGTLGAEPVARLDPPVEVRASERAERFAVEAAGCTVAVIGEVPPGTRGFDDLLVDASHLAVGGGLEILVPSALDLLRIADASAWPADKVELPTLRRVVASDEGSHAGRTRRAGRLADAA